MASLKQMAWNLFHKKEIEQVKASVQVGDVFVDWGLKEWTVTAVGAERVRLKQNGETKVFGVFVVEPREGTLDYGRLARMLQKVDPAESVEQAMKVMK